MMYLKQCLSRRRMLSALAVVGVSLVLTPVSSARADEAAEKFVQTVGSEALAAAKKGGRRAHFRPLVANYAAIDHVATFALGRYRKQLPKARRAEYRAGVQKFIVRLFSDYSSSFVGKRFEVTGSRGDTVKSRIVFANGKSSKVLWRLVKAGDSYKVADVHVSDIWLVQSLRTNFTTTLRKYSGQFDYLFEYLRTGKKPSF